jgi:hypothetical protein
MTWLADLAPYRYFTTPEGVLSVGWLSAELEYTTGESCDEFREKLLTLCIEHTVNRTRGLYPCDFCGADPVRVTIDDRERALGSAEIRIRGMDGQVYGAPNLVWHYVTAHRYRPPDEFIVAILEGEPVHGEF